MNRKEISTSFMAVYGRFPTIVEVNYAVVAGNLKQTSDFNEYENAQFNPSQEELDEYYLIYKNLMYMWKNQDKIRKSIEMWQRRVYKIEAHNKYLALQKQIARLVRTSKEKARRDINKIKRNKYMSGRYWEDVQQREINRARINNVLNFHLRNQDIPIPEAMWGVISKYK